MAEGRENIDVLFRNIVRFRNEMKMSQGRLAELLGMSIDNLRAMEAGKRQDVKSAVLHRLAAIFGRDVGDFYKVHPPAPKQPPPAWIGMKILGDYDPAEMEKAVRSYFRGKELHFELVRERKLGKPPAPKTPPEKKR